MAAEDQRIQLVKANLTAYPDFPKPGVVFQDIFGAMLNPAALKALFELVTEKAASLKGQVDCVLGLDSRGFLFGPTMALELGVPFVPVRKRGKLPGECLGISYDLEYGTASVEIQKAALAEKKRVLIVDDLLATGGTMKAAVDLVKQLGSTPVECYVIIELTALNGRAKLPQDGVTVTSMIPLDD